MTFEELLQRARANGCADSAPQVAHVAVLEFLHAERSTGTQLLWDARHDEATAALVVRILECKAPKPKDEPPADVAAARQALPPQHHPPQPPPKRPRP